MTLLMSGCASLVSQSTWPVEINSIPQGAVFSILDEKGQGVRAGTTPKIVYLDSGNGYFKRASYTVHFKKKGFWVKSATLNPQVNSWYWGNLFLGGLIGMLIIDPVTGAMYKLPETFNSVLKSQDANQSTEAEEYWNYRFHQ